MGVEEALVEWEASFALHFETGGLPRIASRILARLAVSDPPACTASALVEDLGVSKGSVSTNLRLLQQLRLIERAPLSRATAFRLREDGFEGMFETQVRQLTAFRHLADRGLEILHDQPDSRSRRLRHLRALHGFWERRMPELLEEWRRERERLVQEGELS